MYDKLHIYIPIKSEHLRQTQDSHNRQDQWFDLRDLPDDMPLHCDIQRSALTTTINTLAATNLKHAFETLPSSYSGMAIKVEPRTMWVKVKGEWVAARPPRVEIKASPVKFLQGHNAWGWVGIERAFNNFVAVLWQHYPDLFMMLDLPKTMICQLDATYTGYVNDQNDKPLVFKLMQTARHKQTKLSRNFGTTLYFNRLSGGTREGCVYDKLEEVTNDTKGEKNPDAKAIKEALLSEHGPLLARGIRFEARMNARGLKRAGFHTSLLEFIRIERMYRRAGDEQALPRMIWNQVFADLLESLNGQELNVMSDQQVKAQLETVYRTVTANGQIRLAKAKRLYDFYLRLRAEGYQQDHYNNDRTYRRNVKALVDAGISKAMLQGIKQAEPVKVVQFPTLCRLDLLKQTPEGYVEPQDTAALIDLAGHRDQRREVMKQARHDRRAAG